MLLFCVFGNKMQKVFVEINSCVYKGDKKELFEVFVLLFCEVLNI